MRRVVLALVLAVVIPACAKSGNETDSSSELRGASVARLEQTVRAYAEAFLGGRGDAAFELLSVRCRNATPREEFVAIVAVAGAKYENDPIRDLKVEVKGTKGRATYTFDDEELNQTNEPWILVQQGSGDDADDVWRNDDCPGSGATDTTAVTTNTSGSRTSPVPKGQTAAIGDGWSVRVISISQDPYAALKAENSFNDPPAAGMQYVMVRVAATRTGNEPDNASLINWRSLGPSNVTYEQHSDDCGVVPDSIPSKDVYKDGTIEGNVCWQVRAEDAAGLLMLARPGFASTEGTFFRLT